MQRYFIYLSYDGTAYHGWQIQPNANSVQAELQKALSILLRNKSKEMEKVLDEISFDADKHKGETISVDASYVNLKLEGIVQSQDLSRYIL